MEIGTFVREKRRASNLTQQQLADRAGVGLNFVYQLEKNKPTVQLDCTRQVLRALGFDLAVEARPLAAIEGPRDADAGAWQGERAVATRPALPWD
jgi:y4mF family transcriptional regulator